MGWTYTRDKVDLNKAKQEHVWEATRYGSEIKAELIAHEYRPRTFFAIIRLTYPANHDRYAGQVKTWLRIDLIDTSGGLFGYKDGAEEMGMYNDDKPSAAFKKLIYQHIPTPEGYGQEWRERNGVKYDKPAGHPKQEELFA